MSHIFRTIPYAGWKNCLYISNTVFDAVITCDVGPRIIRYGKVGGPNLLWINEFTAGQTQETKTWRAYGGHSFDAIVSNEPYLVPENQPVPYELDDDSVLFAPVIQGDLTKTMKIRMCRRGGLEIIHTVTNTGKQPVNLALNGNTLLHTGGIACLPGQILSGSKRSELMSGQFFSMHQQNLCSCDEYNLQFCSSDLWCAYFTQGSLFIMTSPKQIIDNKCNLSWEVTPNRICMSTRSQEATLNNNESLTHTEVWNIFPDLPQPASEDVAESMLRNNRWYYDFVKKPVKGLDY